MPFELIRQDITQLDVDVIVNAVNRDLSLGSGVDYQIQAQAGEHLKETISHLSFHHSEDILVTPGFNLHTKLIYHTQTPLWQGGFNQEMDELIKVYERCLIKAFEMKCESIAFPLLSSGHHRFPKEKAIKIAMSTIQRFVLNHDILVYLVLYDETSYFISQKLNVLVKNYIHDRLEEPEMNLREMRVNLAQRDALRTQRSYSRVESLDELLEHMEETFTQKLLRLIDERAMIDSHVYRAANIDRRLFSKIRNNMHYQPSKPTVCAFAIALQLNLDETKDLLQSAGYSLSPSQRFDLIIEYCIRHKNYNVFQVNEVLFDFQQPLLGS
ncbi:MAG: macro domain-containing protein [Erysipelothrix sp.]|nr:macro domain-containing protein [Erysipelothrix sp.]